MKHFLEHILGLDGEQIYNLLSGLIPVCLGLGFWGQWWRKHNCHVEKCWRLQWHPHPDNGHIVCRKHHPNGKGVQADMATEGRIRELINITHKHGVTLKNRIKALVEQNRALERLNKRRRNELGKEVSKPKHNITMYDAVSVGNIPHNPEAVAGYVGGSFANYQTLLSDFPKAHHLSIAINRNEDAECLDIEKGDAVPGDAPEWVRRQHARGIKRPCLYASTSNMPAVMGAVLGNGIKRNEFRVWTARWTGTSHIEPGSDATQWVGGQRLDISLCLPNFFD